MSATAIFLFILVGLPILLLLGTKVAQDLDKRGLDGRPYAVLFVFVLPAGLAVWLYFHLTHPLVESAASPDG